MVIMKNMIVIRFLMFGLFILLIFPKLSLIAFGAKILSVYLSSWEIIYSLLQDCIVASVWLIFLRNKILLKKRKAIIGLIVVGATILIITMVDMRARELWLRPIDFKTIIYVANNYTQLTDGSDLFFKQQSGFGFTFRRTIVFMLVVYVVISGLIIHYNNKQIKSNSLNIENKINYFKYIAIFATLFSFLNISLPYQFHKSIFTYSIIDFVNKTLYGESNYTIGVDFKASEKPLYLQDSVDQLYLKNIKKFKNVIIVVYESVRWKSSNSSAISNNIAPELNFLASDGLVTKAYVSIPHSSKSYHSILTGRYPSPGIEIKEAASKYTPSIWHDFKQNFDGKTLAFSSMSLSFENFRGQLVSAGIDEILAMQDTNEYKNNLTELKRTNSSFGLGDGILYKVGIERLSNIKKPYAAFFFPIAAHYPYECPGTVKGRRSYSDYLICVTYSDRLLVELREWLSNSPNGDETLLVIIGDHGESFGERGLYVHNSSLYEEEVTVPWVMWSADKRLKMDSWHKTARQIDLIPTVADLLGLMQSRSPVQGVSLLRHSIEKSMQPMFFSTFYDDLALAILIDNRKYHFDLNTKVLTAFDLSSDPLELNPLHLDLNEIDRYKKLILDYYGYQKNIFSMDN